MEFSTGDVYEGPWRDDKRDGRGVMRFANGDVYDGDWRDDVRAGVGSQSFSTSDKYEVRPLCFCVACVCVVGSHCLSLCVGAKGAIAHLPCVMVGVG